MYDCGCELNEDGQYGRKDYIPHATRGTISLHSWYLMLWTNFGAFCVGLLTQPETHEKLNGKLCQMYFLANYIAKKCLNVQLFL